MLDSRVATHRAAAAAHPVSLLGRLYRLVRDNRALVVLLAAATVIRLLIMIAYQPALSFGGDSASYIEASYLPLRPKATFAIGYVPFLKLFRPTGTLFSVVAAQHFLGLLMAVAIYAVLRHRGVRTWLACLAVVPILFDSLELVLEHAIMVETFAMSLMVAAFVLLLWPRKPGVLVSFLAGGLLISAWFVRAPLIPVVVLVGIYLAIRRIGWLPWLAFVVAAGVPYTVIVTAIGDRVSPYTANYTSYYGRVAGFAKCDQLTLTDAERALCPSPAVSGHEPGWYIWVSESPGYPYRNNGANYPVLRQFAIDVVRQQPMDYLRVAGTETAAQFVDGVPLRTEYQCTRQQYTFPRSFNWAEPAGPTCRTDLASGDFRVLPRDWRDTPLATPLSTAIEKYGLYVRTPHLAILGTYILVGAAAIVAMRGRRRRKAASAAPTDELPADSVAPRLTEDTTNAAPETGPLTRDAVMLAVVGLAIIVLPVAVFMYEARYALPALPLVGLAAGLSAEALLRNRARRRERVL